MTSSNGELLDAFIAAMLDDDPAELYDRAPCGYLSTTPDGTIVKANQTMLTLIGYQPQELIGRMRFVELLSAGGRIYHETHFAPMLRMQGSAREIALDIVRRDGTRLPVLVNAVLERSPDGIPLVVRTAVFDASHRREYERELMRAKDRAEQSEGKARALALTLQQTLIPPTLPAIPGLDVAAEYRPAGDGSLIGGDFYDIFQVGVGDWVVVIGDVCGKGVEAAVVTALARFTLRGAAVQHARPKESLAVLNSVLQAYGTDRFCTVAFLRLTRFEAGWNGLVSSGGHPLPMLCAADGTVGQVGKPGTLLGVLDSPALHDASIALRPGDLLLLYTDGLPEGRCGARFYGEQRVTSLLSSTHDSAGAVVASLLGDVLDFQDGTPRDDIAMVAIRVPNTLS